MHSLSCEVAVAGGGIAGTMAAIAAAREGRKTLLIERYAALGGMGTLGLVQPITMWGIRNRYVIGGTGKKILESLAARPDCAATPVSFYGPSCDAEHLKYELEKRALAAGVELLYHTWITGVEKQGDRISALKIFSKAGAASVTARTVIDATGDADIAACSGVPFDIGSQGISLMFLVSGIDPDRCPPRAEIGELYAAHKVGYSGLALFWHPRRDTAYFNVTEVEGLDVLDPRDLTKATIQCRQQAWEILAVMQRHVPGFEQAYIAQTASALGVRESRRIRGQYALTLQEAEAGAHFEDAIARASCPVDIHGSQEGGRGEYRSLKQSYAIPYRCLVTREIPNLIVTGRCISADHGAHSSLRRMAPGFALGEAAGIAGALACETDDARGIDVQALQRKLRSYDAILDPETPTQ